MTRRSRNAGPMLPLAARRASEVEPPTQTPALPAMAAPQAPNACPGCDGSGYIRLPKAKQPFRCLTCRGHGTLLMRDGRYRARTE